jgi:hypothetical protein
VVSKADVTEAAIAAKHLQLHEVTATEVAGVVRFAAAAIVVLLDANATSAP